jgi:AcrR family transcriptional regulator
MPISTAQESHPRRRSDGERTHAAILEVATQLASVDGIHGLTIGKLAEALGVSKSGLYAHFGSKDQLQLETIAAARAVFEREVLGPALQAPEGLSRLQALCDAYFSYVERGVFRGGCFFAALIAEMDARSDRIREVVVSGEREWQTALVQFARQAQRHGEIPSHVDLEQLAFELEACLDFTNYHFMLFEDPRMLERGSKAITRILEQAQET